MTIQISGAQIGRVKRIWSFTRAVGDSSVLSRRVLQGLLRSTDAEYEQYLKCLARLILGRFLARLRGNMGYLWCLRPPSGCPSTLVPQPGGEGTVSASGSWGVRHHWVVSRATQARQALRRRNQAQQAPHLPYWVEAHDAPQVSSSAPDLD